MPIRSGPDGLLAVLNLGFKHEPCLDMGFMGPHLFSTYLSLVSATLTAVVRDPGLNAYVCLARDLAGATSLDSIMQVRGWAGLAAWPGPWGKRDPGLAIGDGRPTWLQECVWGVPCTAVACDELTKVTQHY